ncbi:hypothetical protein CGLO_15709 [Colletotrichum gloeosporioides Cg-14]|uniref:Uncharacterized protein n=1 Tax=Colletotrichum gloeosporioides (strain Cg-14) TaxID=1237896 RepID=T0LAU3_COLGC|nr:hypothetical protein CGLO_15709 [Colletotrichum gloeosporioides Cg-14]
MLSRAPTVKDERHALAGTLAVPGECYRTIDVSVPAGTVGNAELRRPVVAPGEGPCLGKSSVLVNYEQFHHNPTSPGIDEVVFRAFPVSSQFLFTARPSE